MTKDEEEEERRLRINNYIAETEKYITESSKNRIETTLNSKKIRWFEITLVITIIGLSIAFTKLVL